jgi:hypothetical protein
MTPKAYVEARRRQEAEAYEEALRRIREAEETGALELDLRGRKEGKFIGLKTLNRLPPELKRLRSLSSPFARSATWVRWLRWLPSNPSTSPGVTSSAT